jgi:hypothetical protein
MSAIAILSVLDASLRILERQQVIRDSFQAIRDDIKGMTDEGREPSEAEWATLAARLNTATTTLDDRAEEARRLLGQ